MTGPDDIDPENLDVVDQPARKRRSDLPAPSPQVAANKPAALKRAKGRRVSPGVMLEPECDGYTVTAPHADGDLWQLQLADAFGTRSQSVMRAFINDLTGLCSRAWDQSNGAWKPNETELNAIIAMVDDHRPRTTAEAALAAQAVAIHILTMRLAKQAFNSGGMVMDRDAALTGKLARTYVQQIEALQALKGRRRTTRQSIKVSKELHQHVHYHDARGGRETSSQAHGKPAGIPAQCPALPGPEQGGQVLRLPRRKGKAGV